MNPTCPEEVFSCGSSGGASARRCREGEGVGCLFSMLGAKAGPLGAVAWHSYLGAACWRS